MAGRIAKGVYSAAIAFLGSLGAVLSGADGFSAVTASQWVWIASTTLVAAGGTFGLSTWTGPSSGPGIKNGDG